MARQFFDLAAEDERDQRQADIENAIFDVRDQLEELFSMLFVLTLRTSGGHDNAPRCN